MTPERWQRVERLYHAALERDAGSRPAFLDQACAGDLELRREVDSLLAAHDSGDRFLEIPAAALAADALVEPGSRPLEVPRRAAPTLPATIGRYAVRRRLGGGGMGIVYLAHDPVIDRQVAVKVLRTALDDGGMRERFAREARSAGSLFHRNIVTVFDAGEFEGQPFIAMEFIDGRSVDDMVRACEPLTLERRLRLIEDLCAGLAFAHRHGIVHRDIKPANLMVTSDGVLKVLDFGIARLVDAGVSRATAVGTPSYMSPEQVWGGRVDHRCDIFAVGLVLYEVLTYVRAFPGDSLARICHAIVSEDPRPLVDFIPDLDSDVIRIVAQALRKDPAERFQDVAVLGTELAAARSRLAGGTLQSLPSAKRQADAEAAAPRSPKRRTDPAEIAQRRARRVDEACAAAEAKLAAGQYEEAIAAAEEALVVDPTALRAIRLVETARAKQDDRRARKCLSEAAAFVDAGALTQAEALLREAATLAPGAQELRVLQQRIAVERRERAEADERRQQLASAIERARAALSRNDPVTAISEANAALTLDPASAVALQVHQQASARLEASRRERGDHAQRPVSVQAVARPTVPSAPVLRSEEPPTAATDVKPPPARRAESSPAPTTMGAVSGDAPVGGGDVDYPLARQELAILSPDFAQPSWPGTSTSLLIAAGVVGALSLTGLWLSGTLQTPAVAPSVQTPKAGADVPDAGPVERVAEALARGRRALEEGRAAAAIAAFDEVLAIKPNHTDASDGRGRAVRMLGAASRRAEARDLEEQGRRDEAIKKYEAALSLDPGNTQIAGELEKLRQPPTIPPQLDARSRERANRSTDLVGRAENAYRARDYATAIRLFEDALRSNPNDKRARDGLRRASTGKIQADQLREIAAEGTQPQRPLVPSPPSVTPVERLMRDAFKAMESGDYAAAQRALEGVLRLEPQNARARKLLDTLTGKGL
jgi:tetratricopeptide (TPR) repeat protein/tRNA A-37 threonylcarbamoyl transferase component Bud32